METQRQETPCVQRQTSPIVLLILVLGFVAIGCGNGGQATEVCPIELSTCQQGGGEVCTNTFHDPEHCGACGNVCNPGPQAVAACVQGQCLIAGCQDGYDDCNGDVGADGCETNLSTSTEHCGACGNQCFSTQTCESGMCVDDPNQAGRTYLKITSLGTSGCSAVEHSDITGQQRGSLVVGRTQNQDYFYYMGSTSGGRFDLGNPANNPTQVALQYSIFSDLATGKVYAFTVGGVAAAPECDETIGGFIELDPIDLSPLGNVIALSTPIPWPCENDNGGVFSGRSQVLLHDTTGRTYAITLPAGEVADLGTQARLENARACENWVSHGIAESFDDATYMVYSSGNPQGIVRHSVTTGAVEAIVDFSAMNVRNLCSVGADLVGNQWVWHYVGTGDLDDLAQGIQIAGTCPATYELPPGN